MAATCVVLGLFGAVGTSESGARTRKLVVVGDSIVLGAQKNITDQFALQGWSVTFDAAVSRSTLAGLDAIETHRADLTDSLVIGLGANDAGNPDAFRDRVSRVLDAVSSVPHVYWITIPEVRGYYPAANEVLRSLQATYPNLSILEWANVTSGDASLTAGDGLHLTPSGSAAMSLMVLSSVLVPVSAPAPPTTPEPTPPPTSEPASTTATPTSAPAATATSPDDSPLSPPSAIQSEESAHSGREVGAITSGSASGGRGSDASAAKGGSRAARDDSRPLATLFGLTLGIGFALMIFILGLSGVALGTWALLSTRKNSIES